MNSILEKICEIDSICGHEQKLVEFIASNIPNKCSFAVDNLNSLIVENNNTFKSKHKLVLVSPIDEVGLIINNIEDDGSLKFLTIGKIKPDALIGSVIKINNMLGVIGQKPPHQQSKSERNSAPSINDLFIDLGFDSKEQATKKFKLGDVATFRTGFSKYGNNRVSSKSINSKIGCSVLLKLLQSSISQNFFCTFMTKSNTACFSASAIANSINPDIAIILNCHEETNEQQKVNNNFNLVLSPSTNKSLFDFAVNVAEKQKFQFNIDVCNKPAGTVKLFAQTNAGIKTLEISIPCRLMNSACSNCSFTSLMQTLNFLNELISNIL